MERKALELSEFSVALRKHVDSNSPLPLRIMAAKGLVPMAPEEMGMVLYQLSFDTEVKVKEAARATLKGTPLELVSPALSGDLPVVVLDWMAEVFNHVADALRLIILNNVAADETLKRIASTADADICDLISENQVRLLKAPGIIEALYMNTKARMSTVDKVVDLAKRNSVKLSGLPSLRPLLESKEPIIVPQLIKSSSEMGLADEMFAQFLNEALLEEFQDKEEVKTMALGGDEEEEVDTSNRSMFLASLSVAHKIRFAMLSTRSDRNLLIKDGNRMVHMAAVTSPKVSKQDVVSWAGNRVLPEGVIAYIASSREFLRHYQIKVNLVNNPKTPLASALRLLGHLYARDLKGVSRSRDVPPTLARKAKNLIEQRRKGK